MLILLWAAAGAAVFLSTIGIVFKFYRRNRMVSLCALVAGGVSFAYVAKTNAGAISLLGWLYFGLLFCFWWWIDSQDEKRR